MSLALPSKALATLQDRANRLAAARQFFAERSVMEVDVSMLSPYGSVDAHIDLMPVTFSGKEPRYLQSSPEYEMKRLLASGSGDIYQLSHVFRDGELGNKHRPEFMMVEWYRLGFSFDEMIEETVQFVELFIGHKKYVSMTYREAFRRYAGIDYLTAGKDDLWALLKLAGCETEEAEQEALFNLVMGCVIEPQLIGDVVYAITCFPETSAALAQTETREDEAVAYRFELYYQGVELANGYKELQDIQEHKRRFEKANRQRSFAGKETYTIDPKFYAALDAGLPACCGVAVGFDRLMMVRHSTEDIGEILPLLL